MGSHNLQSRSLAELIGEVSDRVEGMERHAWLDQLLASWGDLPNNIPLSTEAAVLGHTLFGLRGLKVHFSRKARLREAELLDAVMRHNGAHPRSIFLEYVDGPSVEAVLGRYRVFKGMLFETRLSETVVCWHPDKGFPPRDARNIYRTAHSAKGRRLRRREGAPIASVSPA